MTIKILSLGWGNIQKLHVYFSRFSSTEIVSDLFLEDRDILVLPGVGNFDYLSMVLNKKAMRKKLDKHVNTGGRFIGICSGYQILYESSEESNLPGLGYLKGRVTRLPRLNMGWRDTTAEFKKVYFMNRFAVTQDDLTKIDNYNYFYSYTLEGTRIVSQISNDHLLGMQFHPEISREECSQLIADFIN